MGRPGNKTNPLSVHSPTSVFSTFAMSIPNLLSPYHYGHGKGEAASLAAIHAEKPWSLWKGRGCKSSCNPYRETMVTDSSLLSLQVNLSPNLSSNHTPKNRVMYEQVNHCRGSCPVVHERSEGTSARYTVLGYLQPPEFDWTG